MVSFSPTDDQQLLIDTINRFALNDVRKTAHEQDEASQPDPNLVLTGWQMGLVPAAISEDLGGLGEWSALTGVLANEELAFGELSTALHIMLPATFAYPIMQFGTDEQKETYLALCLEENFPNLAAALLEPSITFDPYQLKTRARKEGDTYLLNGQKAYVPLGKDAQFLLVYAMLEDQVQAFIVDPNAEGVTIIQQEKLMGLRALPTYRMQFENVSLSSDALLGQATGIDFDLILTRMHLGLASMAVGLARAAYEYALAYAKERVQFGKPIAQNQSIAFMLAEMAIEIDATRLMVWEAAWKLDQGQDAYNDAYLARQYANRMVLFVTDSAVQTLGGYGFIREYPADRWLRNGRGFPTFDGLAII